MADASHMLFIKVANCNDYSVAGEVMFCGVASSDKQDCRDILILVSGSNLSSTVQTAQHDSAQSCWDTHIGTVGVQ